MPLPAFKNQSLLLRALTHRSFLNEHSDVHEDNERLEYLGDAVLDLIIANLLYHRLPEMKEGKLTRLRSALVRTEQLAQFAMQLDLGSQLRLGKGEQESGGQKRLTLLCDAFEAVVGAYFIDAGYEAARDFVQPLFKPLLEELLLAEADTDAKSLLQEWSQAERSITPRYLIIERTGPDHEQTFRAQALIGDEVVGEGAGRNKRSAEQAAAHDALSRLGLM